MKPGKLIGIGIGPGDPELLTIKAARILKSCGAVFTVISQHVDKSVSETVVRSVAPGARIIHVDIDAAEINKNIDTTYSVVSDAKTFLEKVLPYVKENKHTAWLAQINEWRAKLDYRAKDDESVIHPHQLLRTVAEETPEDTIIATDVGQHQLWSAQYNGRRHPRQFLTSGGLGTMGFGYGAAIGAQIAFPGRVVTARIWRCDVGRTELYLLDTDHDLNQNEDRSITYHLYGGDWENRLKQEMLLGIGGIRALNAMGIRQDVYHCNEGHAAFTGIERIRNLIHNDKLSFSEALEVVRSSSLFTTHTPVPAGHDAFPESMIRQYMSHYPDRLEITWDQFINLGKTNPNDPNEKFSMSFLACNLSQEVNGVSWLHGEVSKEILGGMWPGYFKDELHIGYTGRIDTFYRICIKYITPIGMLLVLAGQVNEFFSLNWF